MFDHHEVDDSKSGEADPSPEYLPTAQYADSGDDDGDSPVAAIQSALRLALRATESDVTCLVVRGRIAYWASRRRTSNTNNDDHGALIAENDATTERRRSSSVLSRWLAKSHSIRVPVDKARGIYLVASRRLANGKFSRQNLIALQDANRIIVGLIDRLLSRYMNRTLSAATSHARMGMIIVSLDGTVLHTNDAARRFIESGAGIKIADNKIIGRCCGGNTTIRDCLAMIKDTGALAIEGENGAASPLSAVRIDKGGRPAIALFMDDPDKPVPPAEWLQTVYQMTRREAQVSSLLAGGQNVSEVAAALGLSEATVKSYCKDVFAKLDVRRKPDLVRTLSSGPLTFAAPRVVPARRLNPPSVPVTAPGA